MSGRPTSSIMYPPRDCFLDHLAVAVRILHLRGYPFIPPSNQYQPVPPLASNLNVTFCTDDNTSRVPRTSYGVIITCFSGIMRISYVINVAIIGWSYLPSVLLQSIGLAHFVNSICQGRSRARAHTRQQAVSTTRREQHCAISFLARSRCVLMSNRKRRMKINAIGNSEQLQTYWRQDFVDRIDSRSTIPFSRRRLTPALSSKFQTTSVYGSICIVMSLCSSRLYRLSISEAQKPRRR